MSEECPILTDKDIELLGKFRKEIAELKSNEPKDDELFSECSLGGKAQTGGANEYLVNAIAFVVTAVAAGASAAFIIYSLPENVQLFLISFVNFKPSMPICKTVADYAIGTGSAAIGFSEMSCSYRAEMLEQGINRLMTIFAGLAGVVLKDKIRQLLDGKLVDNQNAGKRRQKSRKTRRTRKTRRSRRTRKY